jgi:hypothetical protein
MLAKIVYRNIASREADILITDNYRQQITTSRQLRTDNKLTNSDNKQILYILSLYSYSYLYYYRVIKILDNCLLPVYVYDYVCDLFMTVLLGCTKQKVL